MDQSKNKSFLIFCIFFVLFFIINYLTPMHSDDFSYVQLGLSLEKHYRHYMNWSGRILADFVSSFLLNIPTLLKFTFNALAPVGLIFLVVKTFFQTAKVSWQVYLIFFLLYWAGNPSLGETTFWIVGAANYLWTSLFALVFIYLTIRQSSLYNLQVPFVVYAFSALLAGLTNENMSVTLSAFLFLVICYDKFYGKRFSKRFVWVWIFLIVGSAILILSPGNFIRLTNSSYNVWQSYGIFERIIRHIFYRMLVHQQKYLPLYLFIGWILFLIKKHKFIIGDEAKRVILGLIGLSFVVNLVMVASPQYPSRSLMGGFVFLMLALSCLFFNLASNNKIPKKIWIALMTPLLIYFVIVYGLIFRAYLGTKEQELTRIKSIAEAKSLGLPEVEIDDFSFSKLLSRRHQFDRYYEEKALSEYYGINIRVRKTAK